MSNGVQRGFFRNYAFLLIVFILAALAALPQLTAHSVILGVDGLFHFNRFYDVAEQLRHWNLHYFISPYASSSVGRMVNSIYGPIGALLNGGLLLVAGSYLRYQLLSRVVLSLIAAGSMYGALRQLRVDRRTAQVFAGFYPFTYQVVMWNVNQAFTAWGAALLPLGVMLGVQMIASPTRPIRVVPLAVIMALIVQVHLVSALQVVLVLIVYAAFGWVKTPDRKRFVVALIRAVALFSLLCANVIAGFIELYVGNRPLGVARVTDPMSRTLNVLTLQPAQASALVILLVSLVIGLLSWRQLSLSIQVSVVLGLVFFGLSMPILPWNLIFTHAPLIATIQFPERFIAMGTALLLVADAQIISSKMLPRSGRAFLRFGLVLLGLLMVMMNFYSTRQYAQKLFTIPRAVYPLKTYSVDERERVRQLFAKDDLITPLLRVTKSTPDYLPLQKDATSIGMTGYREFDQVNYHPTKDVPRLKRRVRGGRITLSWRGRRNETVRLPVAYYARTRAEFNLRPYHFRGQAGRYLRLPTVQSRPGRNQFTFSYQPRRGSVGLVGLAMISWAGVGLYSGWRRAGRSRENVLR